MFDFITDLIFGAFAENDPGIIFPNKILHVKSPYCSQIPGFFEKPGI
jgi:hypothetical protein